MKYHYSQTDFYTRRAKRENFPARSVYKLEEIDRKYGLFKSGDKVLDLGCAPGSWLLYLAQKVGERGKVVGIDIVDLKIRLPQNVIFIKEDVMKFEPKGNFQSVVSDLAAHTSGIKFRDVAQTLELCQRALEIAKKALVKGGNFLCKVFEGEGTDDFFMEMKKNFEFIKRFKPKASRKQSKEMYIVAKGFLKNTLR